MKLSHEDKQVEQGKAIARGMYEQNIRQEKNIAKAVKRRATMLEHAADKELFG